MVIGEFLLQIQSGLSHGSFQSGIACPKGSILVSTNVKESKRSHGREVRLEFERDPNFNQDQEDKLDQLSLIVDNNKGFLLAWAITYVNNWESGLEDGCQLFKHILAPLLPDKQQRYKGASLMFYTYTMALRWITPTPNVRCNGSFKPAMGITYTAIDHFSTVVVVEVIITTLTTAVLPFISCSVLIYEESKHCDSYKPQSMQFAVTEDATLQDVISRKECISKCAKGIKVTKELFDRRLVQEIEFACGMLENGSDEQYEIVVQEVVGGNASMSSEENENICQLMASIKANLNRTQNSPQKDDSCCQTCGKEDPPTKLHPRRSKVIQWISCDSRKVGVS